MTFERDLGQLLDDWMQEDAVLPDDLDEVFVKLSATRQRHHRWSFTFPGFTWRLQTMFTAARMAALVAVVTLGVGVSIYGGALTPSADLAGSSPAGAAATDDPTRAAAQFEQTVRVRPVNSGTPEDIDGVPHLLGVVSSYRVESDPDPRLVGEGVFSFDGAEFWPGIGPVWGTFRLETEDGAWVGPFSGMARPGETRLSGWLVGEGTYEGMSQYRDMVVDHSTAAAVIHGMIIPGDPPTDPAAGTASTD